MKTFLLILLCGMPAIAFSAEKPDASVVPLEVEGLRICTGTLVRVPVRDDDPKVGIVTAAHCLYAFEGTRLGPRHPQIRAGLLGALALERAFVPAAFRSCADERRRYIDCVSAGGRDVAFVPLRNPSLAADFQPWTLTLDDDALAYAPYVEIRRRTARPAVVSNPGRTESLARVAAPSHLDVSFGDSGSPVFARDTSEMLLELPASPQNVGFVLIGREDSPEGDSRVLLQSVRPLARAFER